MAKLFICALFFPSSFSVTFVIIQNEHEMKKMLNYFVFSTDSVRQQYESPVEFYSLCYFLALFYSLYDLSCSTQVWFNTTNTNTSNNNKK